MNTGRLRALAHALLVPLLVCGSSWAEDTHGSVKVAQPIFEFGSVPQGTKVVHEYELTNDGNADLQLIRITPSCGCTAAAVTSPTVKPGTTEKVRVEFDTAGFSGAKTKTVEVVTSDPQAPEVLLSLKGTILQAVTTSPSRIEFGEISPGGADEAWVRDLTVEIQEPSALTIESVSSFSKYLKVTPQSTDPRKQRYIVELSKDAPRGDIRDRIVIEFKGGRQQAVNVPVTASIRGDLRIVPSTVSFGVIAGGGILERRVKFDDIGKKPISVTQITSSDPAVSGSYVPSNGNRRGTLLVRLDPSRVHGDLKATLDVETDSETEPHATLNVFAVQPPK